MKAKIVAVLGSKNALVTILSMLILAMSGNDIVTSQSAESMYDTLTNPHVCVGAALLINTSSKIVQRYLEHGWSWEFLRSDNFKAGVSTLVVLVCGAVLGEEMAATIGAFVINLYNFVIHLVDRKTAS